MRSWIFMHRIGRVSQLPFMLRTSPRSQCNTINGRRKNFSLAVLLLQCTLINWKQLVFTITQDLSWLEITIILCNMLSQAIRVSSSLLPWIRGTTARLSLRVNKLGNAGELMIQHLFTRGVLNQPRGSLLWPFFFYTPPYPSEFLTCCGTADV